MRSRSTCSKYAGNDVGNSVLTGVIAVGETISDFSLLNIQSTSMGKSIVGTVLDEAANLIVDLLGFNAKSANSIVPSLANANALSKIFSSSRTFPGKSY